MGLAADSLADLHLDSRGHRGPDDLDRDVPSDADDGVSNLCKPRLLTVEERAVPGPAGAPDVALIVCRRQRPGDAARALQMHHSAWQDQLTHAEALLGWDVREGQGQLRLRLALVLRRVLRASY